MTEPNPRIVTAVGEESGDWSHPCLAWLGASIRAVVRQGRQRGGTAASTAGLLSRLLRHEDKLDNVPNARPKAASRPDHRIRVQSDDLVSGQQS